MSTLFSYLSHVGIAICVCVSVTHYGIFIARFVFIKIEMFFGEDSILFL